MAGFRRIRLSDALPHPRGRARAGEVGLTHLTQAEQAREAQESARAREAGSSGRDRLFNVGQAHPRGGRPK